MTLRIPLLFMLITAMLSGCSASSPAPKTELAVTEHEMVRDASGTTVVRLTVKNTGTAVAELAEVTVRFYDAAGGLVHTATDSVMNLPPGETWEFELSCGSAGCSDVEKYTIDALAGTSSGRL